MVVYTELDVDFVQQKYKKINAKAGDNASRFLRLTCYNDGVLSPIDASEVDVFLRYKKPDDTGVFKQGTITQDGKIEIELINQMLTCPGLSYADLLLIDKAGAIIDDDGHISIDAVFILSSMTFCVNVQQEALTDDDMLSSDDYSDLLRLIHMAEINIDKIEGFVIRAETAATNSETSAQNSAISETNAKTSEIKAKTSETNAKTSEDNAKDSEDNAKLSETTADNYRKRAEAWAVGEIDGTPVPNTDETYENNSKWYAEQAEDAYDRTVAYEDHAEAWAAGTIDGQSIDDPQSPAYDPTDSAFHNSSKYWSDLARISVEPFIHGSEQNKTLYASGWFSGSYDLETDYPYADYYLWIQPSADATLAQIKAFGNAILTSEENQNVLVAEGTVPTIDIPCTLYLIAKVQP